MKRLLFLFFFLFFFIKGQNPVFAIADPLSFPNNKFGIHILSSEEVFLAAKMINTSGGDWGYVTIPIQSVDRNLEKWQKFMDDCRSLHIIPIIRIATYPQGENWVKPDEFEAVDFANFLNSLNWPTVNRYVILYNEVNRAGEWGGEVNPQEYAQFLNNAIDIFKNRSNDFFLLNAGLDAAAPNNHILMDEYNYLNQMEAAVPGIFNKFDGWNSHSYPNPDFTSSPWENRRNTIYGYQWEQNYLKYYFGATNKPVFITETGWRKDGISEEKIGEYYSIAFNNAWNDKNIVAVTPFLLSAGSGPFEKFSFTTGSGSPLKQFNRIVSLKKNSGKPEIATPSSVLIDKQTNPYSLKNQETQQLNKNIIPSIWKNIFKWIFYQ